MEQKAGKAAAEKGRIRQKMKKLRGQVSEDRRACWDRKLAKRLFPWTNGNRNAVCTVI